MKETIVKAIAQYGLDLILAAALGVFVKYVAPYIKSKTQAENLARTKLAIAAAVTAAETKFIGDKLGPAVRKPWVKALLEGAGFVVDDLIDAMIDAAAKAVKDATTTAETAAIAAVAEATDGRVNKDTATEVIDALEGSGEDVGPKNLIGFKPEGGNTNENEEHRASKKDS